MINLPYLPTLPRVPKNMTILFCVESFFSGYMNLCFFIRSLENRESSDSLANALKNIYRIIITRRNVNENKCILCRYVGTFHVSFLVDNVYSFR